MASAEGQGGAKAAWTVVLGPGERLAGIEELARAAAQQRDPGLGTRLLRLGDLAELLRPHGSRGRVVLDGDRLPLEDLGFVRRFLAAAPGWSLLLVGEEAGHRAARAALGLPRARWMAWPPDLEQLGDLVAAPEALRPAGSAAPKASGPAASASSAPGAPAPGLPGALAELAELAERVQAAAGGGEPTEAEPAGDLARLTRLARALHHRFAPPPPTAATLDLGALLEDLLAGLTLRGKKAPRFMYRGAQGVSVHAAPAALSQALESLLLLARGCAAAGEVVRVQLLAEPGEVSAARVVIDFPGGPLVDVDPAGLLEGEGEVPVGEVAPLELGAARAVLGTLGGGVDLGLPEEGTARLVVELPAEVQAPADVAEAGAGAGPG